jgi:hypothetical protein
MTIIIDGTGTISGVSANGGISSAQSGSVIQTVSTTLPSVVTTSTPTIGTFVAISGFTVSITPKFSTSKILVIVDANVSISTSGDQGVMYQLTRGGTAIDIGDASGSRSRVTGVATSFGVDYAMPKASVTYLDSPATTSSTTYGLSVCSTSPSRSIYLNRTSVDADANYSGRASSTITVMEIAA